MLGQAQFIGSGIFRGFMNKFDVQAFLWGLKFSFGG